MAFWGLSQQHQCQWYWQVMFSFSPDHYHWKRCKPRTGQPPAPGGSWRAVFFSSLEPQAGGNTIHHFFGCKWCKNLDSIFRNWNKFKMRLPFPFLSSALPSSLLPSLPISAFFSYLLILLLKCTDSGTRQSGFRSFLVPSLNSYVILGDKLNFSVPDSLISKVLIIMLYLSHRVALSIRI